MSRTRKLVIPDTIQIGLLTYSVRFSTVHVKASHPDWIGYCDYKNLEIVLCEDLPRQRIIETLWHEVKHAIYAWGNVWPETELNGESAVAAVAELEILALRANPLLADLILGKYD